MVESKKKVSILGSPLELGNVDFTPLYEACKEYVDLLNSDEGCVDSDHVNSILECALSCMYGEDFWEWHNAITNKGNKN